MAEVLLMTNQDRVCDQSGNVNKGGDGGGRNNKSCDGGESGDGSGDGSGDSGASGIGDEGEKVVMEVEMVMGW